MPANNKATKPAVKAKPVAAKPATKPANQPVAAKPTAVAAPANQPVAKPAEPKQAKPVQAKPMHDSFKHSYAGPSPTFRGHGRKLSRVAIEKFGTLLSEPTSERDNAFLADLRQAYGSKPFPRLDADAGNIRRAGERGYLEHVSGDPISRDCIFRLTAKALAKHG